MTGACNRRLVAFLGAGRYKSASYGWPAVGQTKLTPYVCAALARLWKPDLIHVLATGEARERHEAGLRRALEEFGAPEPDFHDIRVGRSEQGLWQQFQTLVELVGIDEDNEDRHEVLLDITHGFRAQPFFAGAVISVLQAIGRQPARLQVVYAEHRKGEEVSPIWSLDLFVDLIEWAQALRLFLDTGVAEPVIHLGRRAQRRESERIRAAGNRDFPGFHRLVGAIEVFADDLATIRVAALITGYAQEDGKRKNATGSARRLLEAIESCRKEVTDKLPPLALILDRLAATVRPLVAGRLAGPEGRAAMHALARRYLALGRYPEVTVVLREARVSRHADDDRAVEINSRDFDDHLRDAADRRFGEEDPDARAIGDVRNDIEHGGFRRQPQSARALKRRIVELTEGSAASQTGPDSSDVPSRRCFLISRHPGAVEWFERRGIRIDEAFTHLDANTVRPGDVVFGTLPFHQAARVCERGARFIALCLDLPDSERGRELSAEELERLGAFLRAFEVADRGAVAG